VANDFAPQGANPHGAWSYGWTTARDRIFSPYTAFSTSLAGLAGSDGLAYWTRGDTINPTAFLNPTRTDAHLNNSVTLHPGQFALHPGPAGEYSIARWTATALGQHSIVATFSGIAGYSGTQQTTTDVHIRLNGTDLASGYINLNASGNTFSYSAQRNLAIGDIIDFAVGTGTGVHTSDSTGVAASICR
jgi:hypothetical protein